MRQPYSSNNIALTKLSTDGTLGYSNGSTTRENLKLTGSARSGWLTPKVSKIDNRLGWLQDTTTFLSLPVAASACVLESG